MNIALRSPPSPGVAHPGDLYVDLGSRELWLGVDSAVDPAGAVLISDIVGTEGMITDSLTEAKVYTDTQLLTRAPTVHTHTSGQITDFVPAVQGIVDAMPSVNWITGMIVMWSGSLASIGVGPLAGWALCDGSNGTPNLRDRFIVGAGNKAPGSTNPGSTLEVPTAGQHVHTVTGHALTVEQLPAHNHGGATGGPNVDHTHSVSGNTGGHNVDHTHQVGDAVLGAGAGGTGVRALTASGTKAISSGSSNNHVHAIGLTSGGASVSHSHTVQSQGGGQAHAHDMGYAGDHVHSIPSANLREAIPYYALAYIMKL